MEEDEAALALSSRHLKDFRTHGSRLVFRFEVYWEKVRISVLGFEEYTCAVRGNS